MNTFTPKDLIKVRMKRVASLAFLILTILISSCYLFTYPDIDYPAETKFASSESEPTSTPTNIVVYLTETVPSITPTPPDIFESSINYSAIPDGYSLVYFNYLDDTLYLFPEGYSGNEIKVIESRWNISDDGKYLSVLENNELIVFDLLTRNKKEYQLDKGYCYGYSWFPSKERFIVNCSYSLYIYDPQNREIREFIIAQEGVDAFLYPFVSPNGEMVSYGYDSLSTLSPSPDEGLYISDFDCIDIPSTCRDEAMGPFLSYTHPTNILQAWSPASDLLTAYANHKLWVIDVKLENERLLIENLEYIDGLTWHPEGQWVLYSQAGSIYKVPISGGEPILLAENTGYLYGWITKSMD